MKSGKTKLIFSSICLTAALSLAVFTVYAWFLTSKVVSTNGIDSVITPGDVSKFELDCYLTSSENGTSFTIKNKITGENKSMPDYTPPLNDNGGTDTAVLLDLKLTFTKPGNYSITAKTAHSDVYKTTYKGFTEENYLSNVISLREAKNVNFSQNTFSVDGTAYNFITKNGENHYFNGDNDIEKKNTSVRLPDHLVTANQTGSSQEIHIYYLIDYMPAQISSLYAIMLQRFPTDAKLDSQINFEQDIIFDIGKLD